MTVLYEAPVPYKVGVIGVRDHKGSLYTNEAYVTKTFVRFLSKNAPTDRKFKIITGGGKGTDRIIVDWAEKNQIDYKMIPPNIKALGVLKAFVIRNKHIVSTCDELVVYWDGTADLVTKSIAQAMHVGKRVTVIPVI